MTGFVKRLFGEMNKDDLLGMAAEMAYNLMMSLLPGLLFMVSLFGLIGNQQNLMDDLMNMGARFAPPDIINLLRDTLHEVFAGSSGGLAAVGLLTALWTASNGAMVVIKGINRAYSATDHGQPWWKVRLLSLWIVLSLGLVLLVSSQVVLFGNPILRNIIANTFGLSDFWITLISWFRWVVTILALIGFTAYVYTWIPGASVFKQSFKMTLPGAVAFVFLWIGISVLFSYYVDNMANYNKVYGALGGVIMLMFWLYLSSLALLIGGEINAILLDRKVKAEGPEAVRRQGSHPIQT
jgi:membrane protein